MYGSNMENSGQRGDLERQDTRKGRLLYFCIIGMLLLGELSIGHMLAFSGILLPQLEQEGELTNTEKGLIASSSIFGTVIMALICSWLAHKIGRKMTLLLLLTLASVGFLLPVISRGQVIFLSLARLLQGMGNIAMIFPIYVAETASPSMRGPVSGLGTLAINLGTVQVYIMSVFMEWTILSAILAISPALSLIFLALFAPETPSWLMLKGKQEEAESIRQKLQLEPLSPPQANNETNLCTRLTDPVLLKPILVIMGVMGLTMLAGGFSFSFFAIEFFQRIDETINPDIPAIFITALRLFGSIPGVIALHFFNRRSMMIASSCVMAITILLLALTLSFEPLLLDSFPSHKTIIESYWPIALTSLFMLSFSVGLGIIPFVLLGELALPQNAALTSGVGVAFGNFALFLLLQSYPSLVSAYGLSSLCFFFTVICTINVPFIYFCLPETRNRKLEDVVKTFVRSP